MGQSQVLGLLLLLSGLFSVAGGAFGWTWFLHSRRARFIVSLIGRTGSRIFYVILGLLLTVLGASVLLGGVAS